MNTLEFDVKTFDANSSGQVCACSELIANFRGNEINFHSTHDTRLIHTLRLTPPDNIYYCLFSPNGQIFVVIFADFAKKKHCWIYDISKISSDDPKLLNAFTFKKQDITVTIKLAVSNRELAIYWTNDDTLEIFNLITLASSKTQIRQLLVKQSYGDVSINFVFNANFICLNFVDGENNQIIITNPVHNHCYNFQKFSNLCINIMSNSDDSFELYNKKYNMITKIKLSDDTFVSTSNYMLAMSFNHHFYSQLPAFPFAFDHKTKILIGFNGFGSLVLCDEQNSKTIGGYHKYYDPFFFFLSDNLIIAHSIHREHVHLIHIVRSVVDIMPISD